MPHNVLIVEDVDQMRELLKHVISSISGYSVSGTARNGWEARIETTKHRPNLILLDEILPGESCYDLLKDFKSLEIPVILLTGIEKPTHAILDGAIGRIFKPTWDTLQVDIIRIQNEINHVFKH